MQSLVRMGFRWERLPRSKSQRSALVPYQPGGQRVMYSSGVEVSRPYMLALMNAEETDSAAASDSNDIGECLMRVRCAVFCSCWVA
eukprot:12783664-Alexandrium_andersonii.AAC.1